MHRNIQFSRIRKYKLSMCYEGTCLYAYFLFQAFEAYKTEYSGFIL